MQKYSDVINELKASQDVCAQLETRCAEKSTQLDQTVKMMEDSRREFDVSFGTRCGSFTPHQLLTPYPTINPKS